MYLLRLFGGFSLEDSSGVAPAGILYQRSLAVLAILAAARDKGCSRDKLIGYLWAESDQERARHRLSDTIYMLRKSLGDEAVALGAGDILRLNPGVIASDAGTFLDALDAGELETAVGLYDGPFLDGFYTSGAPEFERWAESERQRFAAAHANALERLAEQAEAEADYRRAVEWWKRLADQDPYNSRYALGLMEALARSGDPANAIQIAQEHERLLREELDAEPLPEVLGLAERLRREAGEFVEAAERSAPQVRAVGAESAAEYRVRPRRTRLQHSLAIYAVVAFAVVVAGLTWYIVWGRSSGPVVDSKSIAVLPFVNVGNDPDKEYISVAITGELINHLGQAAGLKVISRTSTMQYKDTDKNLRQIGDDLSVATIVEGEVVEIGDRLRINVQLIDARTDTHLWADQYECRAAEVFEIHSDIAKRIVTALQVTLTPLARERIERKPTEDLQAYDLYLLGRYRWIARSAENLRDAIRYFEAAIERDSTFALAWAGLADAWTVLPYYDPVLSREAYVQARTAAQRALHLDEGLAEVHGTLGALALYHEWDWEAAERHLLRAVELNPNYADARHWLAVTQWGLGKMDLAIENLQVGVSLNPLGNNFHYALANVLYHGGRVGEALAVCRKAEKLEPPVAWGLAGMSLILIREGLAEEAYRVIQHWGVVVGYPNPERLPIVMRAVDHTEFTGEALAVLEDVQRTTSMRAGDLVWLYLHLDAPGEALKVMQEVIAQRHPTGAWLGNKDLARPGLLEDLEIKAALEAAGIRIH